MIFIAGKGGEGLVEWRGGWFIKIIITSIFYMGFLMDLFAYSSAFAELACTSTVAAIVWGATSPLRSSGLPAQPYL